MKPLVSILIPAYNSEKWIAATLESALAQSWPNKEIIVVDDGSKDNTLAVAGRFESQGVRVLTQPNAGAAAARNAAFAASRGDYIQWLDADDLLGPEKIALQMEAALARSNPRTLYSSAWGQFLYRPERTHFVPTALWEDLTPVEWLVRKMGQNLFLQTATWLVSRELTEAAGPWNTRLHYDDDGEYFCRVLLASNFVQFVAGARVYYRVSGSSSVSFIGRSERKREALWESMTLHIARLLSLEDSLRTQAACLRYLQTSFLYFHPERPDIVAAAGDLARELGGQLEIPAFSWKYSWIKALFGWKRARRCQLALPQIRWRFVRGWDWLLANLSSAPKIIKRTPLPL